MKKLLIIILSFILFVNVYPQDTTQSQAFKKNQFKIKYPLIKPKYPSYPLMAGYILKQKAKEGDPFAEHELGLRYLLGRGFPADTIEASYWIRKAANSGIPAAKFNYAIMLVNGIGIDWNPFEAFKNFKSAAESEMTEAEYILGLFYLDNLVVNKNMMVAYKWIKKAADAGNKASIKTLNRLKKTGIKFNSDSLSVNKSKVLQNDSLVIGSLTEPILQDENFELDYYHFNDDSSSIDTKLNEITQLLNSKSKVLKKYLGITADSTEITDTSAIDLVKIAAEFGSPEALLILGNIMESKSDSTKNLLIAMEYYLRALRLGTRNAGEKIINMLNNPMFLPVLEDSSSKKESTALYVYAALSAYKFYYGLPEKEIVDLLNKAAGQNHIPSIIELGLLYNNGTIVKKNIRKARELFTRATELGSKEGRIRLAMLNLINNDTTKVKNDIKLLRKYSKFGSILSDIALAYAYKNGIGVEQNKANADRLYRISASRGNRTAYNALKSMYDEIRPEDEVFNIVNQ